MNTQARQGAADTRNLQHGKFSAVLYMLVCILFVSLSSNLIAQNVGQIGESPPDSGQNPVEKPEHASVSLPGSHQMALALATAELREEALLDLAVAANVLSRSENKPDVDQTALAQGFLDDRAWLQMLVERYGWVEPQSSVLDPAAWLVLGELQQHDLEDIALVFPGSTPKSVLIHQVFNRTGQRLAAANLPALLLEIELEAIPLWEAFLQLTGVQDSNGAAWKAVELGWFTDRRIPPSVNLDDGTEVHKPGEETTLQAMSNMVLSAVDARPPDSRGLTTLRYSVLSQFPALAAVENKHAHDQARYALYLINLIDGLHDGHYFEFIQGLLSITSSLLENETKAKDANSLPELVTDGADTPAQDKPPATAVKTPLLVDWLVKELPAVSVHYASDFANIDPRLNAAMAAVYEVLLKIVTSHQTVAGPAGAGLHDVEFKASRAILADAVAQLVLLIPDMGYYFDTPVRAKIVEEINICISIAAYLDDAGDAAITRRQFDACMETLLQLADQETRLAELSGNMNGPFTTDALRRELSVTPWQRINYGIGYLHKRYSTDCEPPVDALPNPLEWSVLANTMTWLAENSPEFVQTPENESRFTRMRNIGEQLILSLAEQAACLATEGTGINDSVTRGMTDYESALRELDRGIKTAEQVFRQRRLKPEADVSLESDALQNTAYRPVDTVITPCDMRTVCEMSANLSTTRALIGLFPEEYLVAEQTGLGQIEICYRNMEWVQRRSELVRADDENVANYFGKLGFDLVGRYVQNEQVNDIFSFRFTSPEEYHYLFAQTSEDVLNDSCPVEWVGSRVVTPLRENRGGIVPDRLTYLAASRNLPSRLLQNNWDRGAEWRDWFVTGIGVSTLEVPPAPEIITGLNQHLQSLYQEQQAEIYQQVLLPDSRNSQGNTVSLFDEMSQVSIAKAMIRMQMMLFYPESLFNSDPIRKAIAGDAGLVEGRTLRRFREENVTLTSVNGIALERLNEFRQDWSKQPEAVRRQGSVPSSLMHALTRINIVYRQFFASRPEPLQEIEVTAQPQVVN